MSDILCTKPRRLISRSTRGSLIDWRHVVAAASLVVGATFTAAHASPIYGTLSNFDIYFTPPTNPMDPGRDPASGSEGAEIELEGVHASSIGGGYPAHYANKIITEYNDDLGNFAGTRITYTGYNFAGAATPGTLLPNSNPVSTNGHQLTNSAGGEHFGFWLSGQQPTAQRFFWLDDIGGSYVRIEKTPQTVPGPTWTYVPPHNPGEPAAVQVVIKVPEPVEPPEIPRQRPDSTWVKAYKIKLNADDPNLPQDPEGMQALLLKLISDANPEGDNNNLDPNFLEMIDPNDPNLIISKDLVGNFISSNMVAAVLNPIPEPASLSLLLAGAGLIFFRRRPCS